MFKIEKNVAKPKLGNKGSYPFGEMEIGDSIFVPTPDDGCLNAARSAANAYSRYHEDWNYMTRTFFEEDVRGVRIWRIE